MTTSDTHISPLGLPDNSAAPALAARFDPRRSGLALAGLLSGVAVFQAALALGAPWGEFAYGGANLGTLPDRLRMASAVAVPTYAALAAVAAGAGRPGLRRVVLRCNAVLLGVSCFVNLASPSLPERMIWAPVTLAGALLAWRAASGAVRPRRVAS